MGADEPRPPTRVRFLGSIKCRDQEPFGAKDLTPLLLARERVPGASGTTPLVGVSSAGFGTDLPGTDLLDARLGPADLVSAWRGR